MLSSSQENTGIDNIVDLVYNDYNAWTEVPRMRVKYLLMAEHAEAINNKHYIMGGGLFSIAVADFPFIQPSIAVVAAIEVPYEDTTEQHQLSIDIVDADERSILPQPFSTKFETGRPPGMRHGDNQVALMVIHFQNVQFALEGRYSVKLEIDGSEMAREPLQLHRVQVVPMGVITPPTSSP
jgi:hypothetical protein